MTSPLFKPLQLGAISLSHRVVMAPLTRMRAGAPDNVPTELSVEYYRQRASTGGLIISEASQVSQTGQGYPTTPGIHSAAQVVLDLSEQKKAEAEIKLIVNTIPALAWSARADGFAEFFNQHY